MTLFKRLFCGNIIVHIQDSGVYCFYCGEEMKPLIPNASYGAGEKHVPMISMDESIVTVTVGSVEHLYMRVLVLTYRR